MALFGPYKAPPLHVRSSCPSLEHLELKSCDCEFPAIASRSLKNLVLKSCALKQLREITSPSLNNLFINGGYDTRAIVCLLVITAPAATSMFLGVTPHNFTGGLSLSEMPSLAKATVVLYDSNIVGRFKTLGGGVSDVITNLEVSVSKMMVVCLCILYLP